MAELLLFAALGSHGLEVSADTPDFCMGSGDSRWWLEVTSLSPDIFDMPKRVRTIVDTIGQELRSSSYYLNLRLRGSPESTPKKERYLRPLRDLLDTPWDESPSRRESIQIDGLRLTATLIGKGSLRGTSSSVIGLRSHGNAELVVKPETSRALQKSLAAKARKINRRGLGQQVWLAVVVPDSMLAAGEDDLILHALYGVNEFGSVAGSGESFWFRRDRKPVRTRVQGVVVLGPLLWWALEHQEMFCRVYRSPWTDHRPPMPIRRLPTVRVREDRNIIRSDGERFGALIGEECRRFL